MRHRGTLHVISTEMLLWALGGFGEPQYTGERREWIAEDIAELRRLWLDEKWSAPRIAEAMNRTVCAVHEKVSRLSIGRFPQARRGRVQTEDQKSARTG